MNGPLIIGVGGLTSDVGKTTLVCDLLRAFPGWEAIKTTKGHYRSCGKDPHACCVSHLLTDEPVVRSGREATYEEGKDTGRYWDAGASNVHWLIATNSQVEQGTCLAVERVKSPGVIIEGNSFTQFVRPNAFVMVSRESQREIKPSAKRALSYASAIYVSALSNDYGATIKPQISDALSRLNLPVFSTPQLPDLIAFVRSKLLAVAA